MLLMNLYMVKGMYLVTPMDMLEEHDIKKLHKGKSKRNDPCDVDRTIVEERCKYTNLNLEGAYLHVLGDALQSIGVIIGGALIWYVLNHWNITLINF